MKLIMWLSFIFVTYNLHAQEKVYYINIPSTLKAGTITYDQHPDAGDSTFQITLSSLPNRTQDAAYLLICKKKFERVNKSFLSGKKTVTPEMIMDSLTQTGRSFFRKNIFYVLFIRGENYYIHRAIGEYIFMDYRKE